MTGGHRAPASGVEHASAVLRCPGQRPHFGGDPRSPVGATLSPTELQPLEQSIVGMRYRPRPRRRIIGEHASCYEAFSSKGSPASFGLGRN